MAYRDFGEKITKLQSYWGKFGVNFIDRDGFKFFCNEIFFKIKGFTKIYITGYFSETIREDLEEIIRLQHRKVKLICPTFPVKSKRDRNNLQALKKLGLAGAEIRFNERLHARLLIAWNKVQKSSAYVTGAYGWLIVGSFDFNTECIGRERYDAGVITQHPDLLESAIKLFEKIWNEPESITLEEFVSKIKA